MFLVGRNRKAEPQERLKHSHERFTMRMASLEKQDEQCEAMEPPRPNRTPLNSLSGAEARGAGTRPSRMRSRGSSASSATIIRNTSVVPPSGNSAGFSIFCDDEGDENNAANCSSVSRTSGLASSRRRFQSTSSNTHVSWTKLYGRTERSKENRAAPGRWNLNQVTFSLHMFVLFCFVLFCFLFLHHLGV